MSMKFLLLFGMVFTYVSDGPARADEPADRAKLRTLLLEHKKEGWEMLKRKDVAAMRDDFLDDAVLIFHDGSRFSKAEFLKITPDFQLDSYAIEGKVDVLFLTPDAATLVYRITYKSALKDEKPRTVTVLASSTYVRRSGKWLYMFYQETPLK